MSDIKCKVQGKSFKISFVDSNFLQLPPATSASPPRTSTSPPRAETSPPYQLIRPRPDSAHSSDQQYICASPPFWQLPHKLPCAPPLSWLRRRPVRSFLYYALYFNPNRRAMDSAVKMTKAERDKTRKRTGQKQRKRMNVLNNPLKLAFRGWEDEPDPWNMDTCANYIEWCHIGKSFPVARHNYHRRFHKANLRFCTDDAFKNRCIEVYQVLYDRPTVERNEINLFIARGVHAEVKLGKRVNWSTIKERGSKIKVPHHTNGLIPMGVRRYPDGGLGYVRPLTELPPNTYLTSDSSADDDSDGTRTPPRALGNRVEHRAKRRREQEMSTEEVVSEAVLNDRLQDPMEVEDLLPPNEAVESEEDTIPALKSDLNEKKKEIQNLFEDTQKLKVEVQQKNDAIDRQSQEIDRLTRALQAGNVFNEGHVGEGPHEAGHPSHFTAGAEELEVLRGKNVELQKHLDALVSQYYEWKLACVFTVDKNRQMGAELKKIANHYAMHNQERVFGLTSWELMDELFSDKMETKVGVGKQTIIDWPRNGWDFENERSAHMTKPSTLLWPKPPSFVFDGTQCPMCLNAFGPEGGFQLGTCEHLYHPICLIALMVNRRRCVLCKAPFHERLYKLFGLYEHMPPSWEFNHMNAPDHPQKWGEDLIWNWRYKYHSLEVSGLSNNWGWESNPTEVVRVCHNLIKGTDARSEGRRNFFYQCFNGYWDGNEHQFRFGPHPKGWTWGNNGKRIMDDDGVEFVDPDEYVPPNARERVMMSESEWREQFKNDAVDFLLEEHSPGTRIALRELQQSQILRGLLEEDGPARRTRGAMRRLRLDSDEDDIPVSGTHDTEAGTSGTANSPVHLD